MRVFPRTSLLVLSLPLLGIARLLPAEGVGLWLRLLAASLVLLLPGALVARVLRLRGAAVTVAWALAALTLALLVVFLVHTSIWIALAVLGGVALAALPFSLQAAPGGRAWASVAAALAGLVFGAVLWHVAGVVHGDALFHLGRVRKLDAFGSLHVRSVDEFANGGLHPGYAFPLWHGFLALVAKLAGVDPTQVMLHEPSAVAPIAFAAVYEAGVALFRSAWLGFAVLVATVASAALAPGHGGSYALLGQPGTIDRLVLVPAALTVFFLAVRKPGWRLLLTLAGLGGGLFLVHASTAVFLALVLAGYAVARWLLTRSEIRSTALAYASLVVPAGIALVWIAPIVGETASHSPGSSELERSLAKYAPELHVHSLNTYSLRPEVFARGGAIAVAALAVVPLAFFATRRRWAAFVLGGSLLILALELVPWLFPHFADAVSLSQARRAAGFVPFAFALTGGAAVLACVLRFLVLPVALAAGIALQQAYPGGFGGLAGGGPAAVTWIAAIGGAVALVAGVFLGLHKEARGPLPGLAALLFALPVIVHGFQHWSPAYTRDPSAPTPGLLAALRHEVPKRAVVFSDLETSYRISAYAPVYVSSAPPAHVADTRANYPYGRRKATIRYFGTGDIKIPEQLLATWIVVDKSRFHVRVPWRLVYADRRYALYHRTA
ncbi:MAG: hypothetical protein E6G50_14805 [Actinobacteria bacterium]|nr:MAG: hypothetical protein E6G50_14805 [Actinomycetota bacterium]